MKRTTLILEEGCMRRVRDAARREGRPMSHLVNELLVEGLRRHEAGPPREFSLPSFKMGAARVDLADRDALDAAMGS